MKSIYDLRDKLYRNPKVIYKEKATKKFLMYISKKYDKTSHDIKKQFEKIEDTTFL